MILIFVLISVAIAQNCDWVASEENGQWNIRFVDDNKNNLIFTETNGPFLYTGNGNLNIETERGEFWVHDYTESRIGHYVDSFRKVAPGEIQIVFDNKYELSLNCQNSVGVLRQNEEHSEIDRFWLRFYASGDEAVYGGGEQFSYFNLRGRTWPMLTREQGVGRNISEIVGWVSKRCCDAMGDYHHTYWPQPTAIIKSPKKNYYVNFWSNEFSNFDLRNDDYHEYEFHITESQNKEDSILLFNIDFANDYASTVQLLANSYGKQERLPDWVTKGTIVGLQGGTERIKQIYKASTLRDIDINGIWIQDWSGQIFTEFGDRVFWNWEWNSTQYPGLDELIPEMADEGTYFLNYLNPHFLNSPSSDLYVYGSENEYFVKNKTTGEELVQNFGFNPFQIVTIDLSNPDAAQWFKNESFNLTLPCHLTYNFAPGKQWFRGAGEHEKRAQRQS